MRKAGFLRGRVNICGAVTQLGAGPSLLAGPFATPKTSQPGSALGFGTLRCASTDSRAPDPNSPPPTLRTFLSEPQLALGRDLVRSGSTEPVRSRPWESGSLVKSLERVTRTFRALISSSVKMRDLNQRALPTFWALTFWII